MQIPDYKKTTESPDADAFLSIKPLPSLAAVSIKVSASLTVFYRLVYGGIAISLFIAFLPWLLVKVWWWGLLLLLWYGLWLLYRRQLMALVIGSLWFEQGNWFARFGGITHKCQLAGEIVCWPFILILPLNNDLVGKFNLVIAVDSISPADNARLRTWLQVCLRPKA